MKLSCHLQQQTWFWICRSHWPWWNSLPQFSRPSPKCLCTTLKSWITYPVWVYLKGNNAVSIRKGWISCMPSFIAVAQLLSSQPMNFSGISAHPWILPFWRPWTMAILSTAQCMLLLCHALIITAIAHTSLNLKRPRHWGLFIPQVHHFWTTTKSSLTLKCSTVLPPCDNWKQKTMDNVILTLMFNLMMCQINVESDDDYLAIDIKRCC